MDKSNLMAGLTVLVLAGVVFFGSSLLSNPVVTGLAVSSSGFCFDSDGNNPSPQFVKGTVTSTVVGGPRNGTLANISDVCLNSNTVREYYCNSLNHAVAKSISCANGCVNGACVVPAVATCTDSDGGNNSAVFGTVSGFNSSTLSNYSKSDSCLSGNYLEEWYCSGTVAKSTGYGCQYGCENGVCKPQPIATCTDSDGNNTMVAGTVSVTNSSGSFTMNDYCSGSNVWEQFCRNRTSNDGPGDSPMGWYGSYYCTYGCSAGACLPQPASNGTNSTPVQPPVNSTNSTVVTPPLSNSTNSTNSTSG